MSKKISLGTLIVTVLLAILLTFSVTYSTVYTNVKAQAGEKALEQDESVFSKVEYVDELYRKNYVGELDDESVSNFLVRGYLAGTGDKYAYYMTKDEMTAQMNDTKGTMVGIGIQVFYDNTENVIEVIACFPDSPAEKAGILPGDRIYAVDGESIATLGYSGAVDCVQGEEGTAVSVSLLRDSVTMEFKMTRAKVDNVSVTYRMYDDTVGIVRLYLFSENTGGLVKEAVEALTAQGATKLIFDVRSNSGGELNGIVNTLDYLLPAGPILHIQNKNGKQVKQYDSDEAFVDMPMAVLVNGTTASAAELFAAGLQDYKAATIVGTQTFGKGTVCSIVNLPDGSGLLMSTEYYTPPYSDSIEGKGVTPDVVVEMDDALFGLHDADDVQLQAALTALS